MFTKTDLPNNKSQVFNNLAKSIQWSNTDDNGLGKCIPPLMEQSGSKVLNVDGDHGVEPPPATLRL